MQASFIQALPAICRVFEHMKELYPDRDLYTVSYGSGISVRSVKPEYNISQFLAQFGGDGDTPEQAVSPFHSKNVLALLQRHSTQKSSWTKGDCIHSAAAPAGCPVGAAAFHIVQRKIMSENYIVQNIQTSKATGTSSMTQQALRYYAGRRKRPMVHPNAECYKQRRKIYEHKNIRCL